MMAIRLIQPMLWSLLATGSGDAGRAVHAQPPRVSGTGTLDAGLVLKTLTAHQFELNACFQLDVNRGIDGGRLMMSWQILANGSVADARPVEAPANGRAGWCIARQMARWVFPKPAGGPVSVRHLMVLSREPQIRRGMDEGLNRRPLDWTIRPDSKGSPKQRERCWVMKGVLDTSAITTLIDQHGAKLARCVELAVPEPRPTREPPPTPSDAGVLAALIGKLSMIGPLSQNPPVQVELTLSAAGKLLDLNVNGRDQRTEQCLRAEMATWSLPAGKGDAVVGCELWALAGSPRTSNSCRSGARTLGMGCQLGDGKEGPFGRWTADGAPIELGAFLHGRRHGTWTTWHPSRPGVAPVRRQVESWSEGQLHGEWESWNEAGARITAGAWEHGSAVGTWRRWHPNGAPQSVTEHARPGVVASVTHSDELGELTRVDTYDSGRVETARFASGEPVPEGAAPPPMCRQLDVQPLPPPGFPPEFRLRFQGFVGEALVFIATSPTALEARVYLAGQGRWAAARSRPVTGRPIADLNAQPLEGGQLFVWSDWPPMAHVLDVPGLTWRSLAAHPAETRVAAVGRHCAYAWPRLGNHFLLQRGVRWCLGDGGWTALPAPEAFATTERLVTTAGDDLFAVSWEKHVDPIPRLPPSRWRGAAYESDSRTWRTVEIPELLAQPLLLSTRREAVLVDTGYRGPQEPRGGLYGRPAGAWVPFTIPGFQRSILKLVSPGATEVVLVREDSIISRLLLDATRRRWSAVPEEASSWPHFLWADGRLKAMSDHRYVPGPRFSVLDWATRRWCEVWLGHESIEASPGFDSRGRPLATPTSTFGLFVGDGAAAIWGRDDVTPLPCGTVVCAQRPTSKHHADVGVLARWPVTGARP